MLFASIAGIAILGGIYAFQVNSMTADAYTIANANNRLNTLMQANRDLNSSYAQQLSFHEFEGVAQSLNFQKVENVSYFQLTKTSVAQRQ